MLNCKQVTKIISSEDSQSWRRKLEVRFHLLMCKHCRKYAKHIDIIKTSFKNIFQLSDADKEKINEIEQTVLEKIKNLKK